MLPTLNVVRHKTKLISNSKEIEFRPFLAKEQKILLMALEGGDVEGITNAVLSILKACILTPGIDVMQLPPFDIQKLFLELRKRSVGEVIELKIRHPEEDHKCEHAQKISVDLNDVQVIVPEEHSRKFKIDENIGVVMRYPSGKLMEKFTQKNVQNTFAMIGACIESVYDAENLYSDFTETEINDWVGQLNTEQLQKVTQFFHTMPSLRYDIDYKCSACGEAVHHTLENIADFFS